MKTAVLVFEGGSDYIKEMQVENALDRCNENFALSVKDYDDIEFCLPHLAEAGVENIIVFHKDRNFHLFEYSLNEEYGRYFNNIEVIPELFPRLYEDAPKGKVEAGLYKDAQIRGDVSEVAAADELYYEIYAANAPVWGCGNHNQTVSDYVDDATLVNVNSQPGEDDVDIDPDISDWYEFDETMEDISVETGIAEDTIEDYVTNPNAKLLPIIDSFEQDTDSVLNFLTWATIFRYNGISSGAVSGGADNEGPLLLESLRKLYEAQTQVRRPIIISEQKITKKNNNGLVKGEWFIALDSTDQELANLMKTKTVLVHPDQNPFLKSNLETVGKYYVIKVGISPFSVSTIIPDNKENMDWITNNTTIIRTDSIEKFNSVIQSFCDNDFTEFNNCLIKQPTEEQLNTIDQMKGQKFNNDETVVQDDQTDQTDQTTDQNATGKELSTEVKPQSNSNNNGGNNSLVVSNKNSSGGSGNNGENSLIVVDQDDTMASGGQNKEYNVMTDQHNQTNKKGALLTVSAMNPDKNGIWSPNAYKLNTLKKGVVFNIPENISFCRSWDSLVRSLRQQNLLKEGGTVTVVTPVHMIDALGNAKQVSQQYNVNLNVIPNEKDDYRGLTDTMIKAFNLGVQIIKKPKIVKNKGGYSRKDFDKADKVNDQRSKALKAWKAADVMPFTSFLIKALSDIKATIELGTKDEAGTGNKKSFFDTLFRNFGVYEDLSTASKNMQNGGAALIVDATKFVVDMFKKDDGTKTTTSDGYIQHDKWPEFASCFAPNNDKINSSNLKSVASNYVES